MSAANLLQFNLFGEPDELAGSGVDESCNEALDDQLDEKLDELLDQAATEAIEAVEAEAVPVALEPEAIADLAPSSIPEYSEPPVADPVVLEAPPPKRSKAGQCWHLRAAPGLDAIYCPDCRQSLIAGTREYEDRLQR